MKVLSIILLVLLSLAANSQVSYTYDSSGNRIKREITLKSATIPVDTTVTEDVISDFEGFSNELFESQLEESFEETTVKVYPNPTKGEIYMEFNQFPGEEAIEFEVWSPTGNMLQRKRINDLVTRITLRGRPSGIYILRARFSGKMETWKIIKE